MGAAPELPALVRTLVDVSADPACVVDRDLALVHSNANYLRLAGLRPRELARRAERPVGMCHEHFGLESCLEGCVSRRAIESGRQCRVDEVNSTKLGLRLIVIAVPLLDERGTVVGAIETYRDVTAESRIQENYRRLLEQEREQKGLLQAEVARQTVELAKANAELRKTLAEVSRLAVTDGLTGLYNRRQFDEHLGDQIDRARRRGSALALLLFDLDHFKRVNDTHGHPAGDQTLKGFADVLRQSVRDDDLAARIGGEEFAVVLPGADPASALAVGERVRVRVKTVGLLTTASGGVAAYPRDGTTKADLLRAADRALYSAKLGGRDRIVAADELPPDVSPFAAAAGDGEH
jgi:diguanylate cyclase (GGDEF)-like protein